ncbi:MAG: hypothetical protein M3N04_09055 [Actinomycetota bacterium]|nr:hypothetical protein [Actinomycetota bacterium]
MRIAIDIDSTLHHYWDRLSDAALRRFGIDLPYEEQLDWGITRLRPDQLRLCIEETHCSQAILAGEPYPDAAAVITRWRAEGHFIHITSHRESSALQATAQWLAQIGVPYDDLHCSDDKVSRCVELGIELLIDDSPLNLVKAIEHGILVATISHPWNRDVCEEEDVVCADHWSSLAAQLEPVLRRRAGV